MSAKQLAALAIKFLALWFLVNLVLWVPALFRTLAAITSDLKSDTSQNAYFALSGSFLFIGLIVCVILFRVSNSILDTVPDTVERSEQGISQSFLLQVLGAYFVVTSLAVIPNLLFVLAAWDRIELKGHGYLVAEALALVIGVYLLARPERWRLWFSKLRGRT